MLTIRVFKHSAELRAADLSGQLRQPSANSAEDAARGLPCPYAIPQVAFHGFANRHAGVPGAQYGQFVSIGKACGSGVDRTGGSEARFHRRQFGTNIKLL